MWVHPVAIQCNASLLHSKEVNNMCINPINELVFVPDNQNPWVIIRQFSISCWFLPMMRWGVCWRVQRYTKVQWTGLLLKEMIKWYRHNHQLQWQRPWIVLQNFWAFNAPLDIVFLLLSTQTNCISNCNAIHTGWFFFHWYPPKKIKYEKPRLGESTLT